MSVTKVGGRTSPIKVAVAHNIPVCGRPDSEDVIDQVGLVTAALETLGYDYRVLPVGGSATPLKKGPVAPPCADGRGFQGTLNESVFSLFLELKRYSPDVIFNLVEDTPEFQIHQHYFTVLFEAFGYCYTGSGHNAILTTTDKALTKLLMNHFGIPTPAHQVYTGGKEIKLSFPPPYILKPSLEDGSIGIEDGSVFSEPGAMLSALPGFHEKFGGQPIVIEQYIDGREFNISLIETPDGARLLPAAEMRFEDWPEGKPRIVGYKAKWIEDAFEYEKTVRVFHPDSDSAYDGLREAALRCWKVFDLEGFARVDMRLSEDGRAYVLEVNANPCIAPWSGFISAMREAGYTEADFVRLAIESALRG